MDPPDSSAVLVGLSDLLDDGTDLDAIIAVLQDDLISAVPSYLGLRLTLVTGDTPITVTIPITVTLPNHGVATAPRASLRVPLTRSTGTQGLGDIVFYAADPHAFIDLAADTRRLLRLDGQVQTDQHLDLSAELTAGATIDGLAERSHIDQAVGVLIDQGRTPAQALDELRGGEDTMHRNALRVLGEEPGPAQRPQRADGLVQDV